MVTHRRPVTLHHCHGGSIAEVGIRRGVSQKTSDWLVIPLDAEFHVGRWGIDSGQPWLTVEEWERLFGSQVLHLDTVSRALGINVWKLSGVNRAVVM